jgi:periplasmic protein TonB
MTATSATASAPPATPTFVVAESTDRLKTMVAMVVCALAVFLLLPFTQYISSGGNSGVELRSVDVTLPPPPPPPPEPPPPEENKVDEPPPQMDRPPPQLSLSQMELAMNPGIGDAMAGAFAFEGFGVQPDAVGDLQIFDVADLDEAPRRTKSVLPVYPPELKKARVQGEVTLILIIDATGRPSVEKVLEFTKREFVQAAVTAAEQCLYEPPKKDGQAVRARYSLRIPFRLQ